MAIKTKEQLFGDDAANGVKVPIRETPAPGLGTANRAVKLGEGLTAAVHNGACYALALNDEDLDTRIKVIEVGGLDAVYRLAGANVPGGGRVINVDGGAVEVHSALAANLATDLANALIRANALGDAINGSVGVDFVAKGAGTGIPLFGFLDRRSLVITTPRTKLLATNAGVLNPASAGGAVLGMADTGLSFWAQSGPSDILPGVDMVEVQAGPYKGLYLIAQLLSDANVRLLALSGVAPNCTADTAVTFKVFRPAFTSSGGTASDRAGAGVTIAGVPGTSDLDTAALTLVPGGRQGAASVPSQQGSRYALRVRVLPADPAAEHGIVGVTARGSFVTESFASIDAEARYAKSLGTAGFRYLAPPSSGGPAIAFAALHQDTDNPSYPAILQGRVAGGAIAGTFDGNFTVTVLSADLGTRFLAPSGTLLELFRAAGGASLGVFRMKEIYVGDPGENLLLLKSLTNLDPYDTPVAPDVENIAVIVQFLQGIVVGNEALVEGIASGGVMLTDPDDPDSDPLTKSRSTVFVTLPYDLVGSDFTEQTPAGIHIASASYDPKALLIRGMNRYNYDSFLVSADGQVTAAKGFYAPGGPAIAESFRYAQLQTLTDIPIPPELMSPQNQTASGTDAVQGWYRNGIASGWNILAPTSNFFDLIIPITGIAPVGAQLTELKLYYETAGSYLADQSYILWLYSRAPFTHTLVEIAHLVLPAKSPAGTVTIAVPAGHFTHRSSPMLAAMVTNQNLTSTPNTSAMVLVHSAYISCTLPAIES